MVDRHEKFCNIQGRTRNGANLFHGNGGQVIIWSDRIINFRGNIGALRGGVSEDRGFVEVGGKEKLISERKVDITATSGAKGRILLAPESVTVGKDSSEIYDTENTDNSTTEFADNSEAKKTETPFVPFAVDENFDVIISPDNLGDLSDHVIIDADNYITRTYAKKPISTVDYCF